MSSGTGSKRRLLITLFCGLLLTATLLAARLRRPPAARPLPPAHTVVLLLAPALSADECAIAPNSLRRLFNDLPHGVLTTRNSADAGPIADPMETAARVLVTGNRTPGANAPTLAGVLRRQNIDVMPVTNRDTIACEVTDTRQPNPILADDPAGHATLVGFPDGYVTDPIAFAHSVRMAADRGPEKPPALIVATLDDLYRADQYAPLATATATMMQRAVALERLDATVGQLTSRASPQRLPDDVVLLLVSPLPAANSRARGERLGAIIVWSAGLESGAAQGLLTSPSTRQTPGLIAGTDVAATIASLLGIQRPLQAIGDGRAADIVDDDGKLFPRIVGWDAQARAQSLQIYVPWALAAILIAASLCARVSRLRASLILSASASLYPVALIVVGASVPHVLAAYTIALFLAVAIPLAAMSALRRVRATGRTLFATIGGITAAVILGDTWTGGFLLSHTPLSYSVMEAARFYGIGNEAAGVLIGGGLTAAILAIAEAPMAVTLLGLSVALTLLLPTLGAKAGSFLGAMAGFSALVILQSPFCRGRRGVAVLATTLALIALSLGVYAAWDTTRGAAAETHVGAAVSGAHRLGPRSILTIAHRKASMETHLLTSSPWAALLAVEVILIGLDVRDRRRHTARATKVGGAVGQTAFIIAGATLLLFNDAGVVGAALCLLFAIPLPLLEGRQRHDAPPANTV